MPKQKKNLDDGVLMTIINDEASFEGATVDVPSSAKVQRLYNEETGESLHLQTVINYLQRTDQYVKHEVTGSAFGWSTRKILEGDA